MAKETTEKFNIKTMFLSPEDKIAHIWWNNWNGAVLTQLSHDKSSDLGDDYTITLKYPNIETKFRSYFTKGEWVTSWSIVQLNSTPMNDEFEVEVTYKGGQKKFEKTFHNQTAHRAEVKHTSLSSKTKNLGILNPHGQAVSEEHKETLNIMRLLFIDALKGAGLQKQNTIPKNIFWASADEDKFSVAINNGGDYFYCGSKRLVCTHLQNWKVGFLPEEKGQFSIRVSYLRRINYRSKPEYWPISNDFLEVANWCIRDFKIYKSWAVTNWGEPKPTYNKFFLGDPQISKKLTRFFKALNNLAPPAVKDDSR